MTAVRTPSSLATRIVSFAVLCGVVAGIGAVGSTVYRVATDGFIAPIILSPDSDMVIQSKLSMSQLLAERMRITSKKDEIEAELQGAEEALAELKTLHAASTKALEWTASLTQTQATAGVEDERALVQQRATLAHMITEEEVFLDRMKKDLEGGLVSKVDYAREVQTLNQLRVAAIENDRSHIASALQMSQVKLTQRAIQGSGPRLSTPEMLMQQDQLVRVRCEMIRLESERRSKLGERRSLDEELAKLDELLGQLKSRPIFRAIDANMTIAFVPYTQMTGVQAGTRIYDCVWGVFACKEVGHVDELLPGEAIVQDPWGSPARGLYAVMTLQDSQSAQSKTLRVRPSDRLFDSGRAPASMVAKK